MDEMELAELVHMTPDHIRQVEAGIRPLTSENLVALAHALEVEVDIFFQEENSQPEPQVQSMLIPVSQLSALLDQMKD